MDIRNKMGNCCSRGNTNNMINDNNNNKNAKKIQSDGSSEPHYINEDYSEQNATK